MEVRAIIITHAETERADGRKYDAAWPDHAHLCGA